MKVEKVKVFNAYIYDDEGREYYKQFNLGWHSLFDFHNQIVQDDGYVYDGELKIKPREQDIELKCKYVLDEEEANSLKSYEILIKEYEDKLKKLQNDQHRCYKNLLSKTGLYMDDCFIGDWDCNLSPIGICICRWDGNDETCIFCGEPNERK